MFVSDTFLSTAGTYKGFFGLLICLTVDLCLLELKFKLVVEAGCGKKSSEGFLSICWCGGFVAAAWFTESMMTFLLPNLRWVMEPEFAVVSLSAMYSALGADSDDEDTDEVDEDEDSLALDLAAQPQVGAGVHLERRQLP